MNTENQVKQSPYPFTDMRHPMNKYVLDDIHDRARIHKFSVGEISDGYHTFNELYAHRIRLYITVCKFVAREYKISQRGMFPSGDPEPVWCSRAHSDGSVWDGWFLLGIGKKPGKQITYHLPTSYWKEVTEFAEVLEMAPQFDGHSSADVLERITGLI